MEAAEILPQANVAIKLYAGGRGEFIAAVHGALYASNVISYVQAIDLPATASKTRHCNLQLSENSGDLGGGCIIGPKFFNDIADAFRGNPNSCNLMLDPFSPKYSHTRNQAGAKSSL